MATEIRERINGQGGGQLHPFETDQAPHRTYLQGHCGWEIWKVVKEGGLYFGPGGWQGLVTVTETTGNRIFGIDKALGLTSDDETTERNLEKIAGAIK